VPKLAIGATIYDPQGGQVGTIESVINGSVVIDTGNHKATLPKSAFGTGDKGPTITATKAQVDALVAASIQKADAALIAALVPGAEVRGKSGALVGTIKEVTGDQILLDRPGGPVVLTSRAFATGPQGLVISMTAAELEAAARAAKTSP
jgi:preprotein translocase subunit YajC